MKYQNTLQKGAVRFLIFREGETWYGACLEFNIVETGDTHQEVLMLLLEAVNGYLESARKIKTRPHILNQRTDSEYEMLWQRSQEAKRRKLPAPRVFMSGWLNLRGGQPMMVPA